MNYYSMLQANIFVKKVKFEFLQLNHNQMKMKFFKELLFTVTMIGCLLSVSQVYAFTPAQERKLLSNQKEMAKELVEVKKEIVKINTTLRMFMEQINKRFEDMNKRFEAQQKMIDKRFDMLIHMIDKRFEDMLKRFDDINTMMKIYGGLLAAILTLLFVDMKRSNPKLTASHNEIMKRLDRLEDQRKQEIDAYIEKYVRRAVEEVMSKEMKTMVKDEMLKQQEAA